jgi:hypothetical protein
LQLPWPQPASDCHSQRCVSRGGPRFATGSPTPAHRPHHHACPLPPSGPQGTVSVAATVGIIAETDASSNPLAFTFTLDRALAAGITVYFNLSGTATFGVDYQPLAGQPNPGCSADGKGCSVTVVAGTATASVFFEALDDTIHELDDSVVVTLVPGSYYIGSSNNATGLIQDDEDRVGLAGGRAHRRCWGPAGLAVAAAGRASEQRQHAGGGVAEGQARARPLCTGWRCVAWPDEGASSAPPANTKFCCALTPLFLLRAPALSPAHSD